MFLTRILFGTCLDVRDRIFLSKITMASTLPLTPQQLFAEEQRRTFLGCAGSPAHPKHVWASWWPSCCPAQWRRSDPIYIYIYINLRWSVYAYVYTFYLHTYVYICLYIYIWLYTHLPVYIKAFIFNHGPTCIVNCWKIEYCLNHVEQLCRVSITPRNHQS